MFLAQARLTPGFHVAVVADLNVEKALQALTTTGWAKEQFAARGLDDALKSGATWVTDDAGALFKTEAIEVVIDATGQARQSAVVGTGVSVRVDLGGSALTKNNKNSTTY